MKYTISLLIALLCLCFAVPSFAFNVPAPDGYVTDKSGNLTTAQVQSLNSRIKDINDKTQNEIGVLIIPSLDGENIEDVTHQVFRSWKVGKAGLDNGVLLVLAINDRKSRIQTGRGTGGDLTDVQANEILVKMRPQLRSKDYYGAVELAVNEIGRNLESRHGQKVDPGKGAQFGQPLPQASDGGSPRTASCSFNAVETTISGVAILMVGLFVVFWLRNRRHQERHYRIFNEKVDDIVRSQKLHTDKIEAIKLPEYNPHVSPIASWTHSTVTTTKKSVPVSKPKKSSTSRRNSGSYSSGSSSSSSSSSSDYSSSYSSGGWDSGGSSGGFGGGDSGGGGSSSGW